MPIAHIEARGTPAYSFLLAKAINNRDLPSGAGARNLRAGITAKAWGDNAAIY